MALLLRPLGAPRLGIGGALIVLGLVGMLHPSFATFLPSRRLQLPQETYFKLTRTRAALRWGISLGIGVRTYVVTPAFFALLGALVVQTSIFGAVAIGLIYGLTRGVVISIFAVMHNGESSSNAQLAHVDRLKRGSRVPLILLMLTLAGLLIGRF